MPVPSRRTSIKIRSPEGRSSAARVVNRVGTTDREPTKALSKISLLIRLSGFWCRHGGREEDRGRKAREEADAQGNRREPEARESSEGTIREAPPLLPGEDRDCAARPSPKFQRLRDLVHARSRPALPRD